MTPVAPLVVRLVALPADGAPLAPTPQQARSWAQRELAQDVYARHRPGLLQRAAQWLWDHVERVLSGNGLHPSAATGVVLLVVVVAVVAAVLLLRAGRLRGPGRVREGAVFDAGVRSAADHRRLADAAAARGDWAAAVRERFRAVARALEERAVLDERPGRTAHEVAEEAAGPLAGQAAALRAGADAFDDVCYGGREATAAHDAQLRELDAAVAAARPAFAGAGA